MSIRQIAMVWELDLPGDLTITLMAMADHAHPDGTFCYPSNERLAKYSRCSVPTVQRRLKRLAAGGYIALEVPGGRKRWRRRDRYGNLHQSTTNLWRLTLQGHPLLDLDDHLPAEGINLTPSAEQGSHDEQGRVSHDTKQGVTPDTQTRSNQEKPIRLSAEERTTLPEWLRAKLDRS